MLADGEYSGDARSGAWLPPTGRRLAPLCSPAPAFSPLLARLLAPLVGLPPRARLTAVTDLLWAVLAAQSRPPAALVRALPHPHASGARQGVRRGRRLVEWADVQRQARTPALKHSLPTPEV